MGAAVVLPTIFMNFNKIYRQSLCGTANPARKMENQDCGILDNITALVA